MRFGLREFLKRYQTDDDCLEELKNLRYPHGITCSSCKKVTKHYKLKKRLAYSCSSCGTHTYPLHGTVFQDTKIELRLWFYAVFVLTQTYAGVSAKTLQRELGISYPTALRMAHQIRKAMKEEGITLHGITEVDETYWRGDGWNRRYVPDFNERPKEVIMGFLERDGRVITKHIPDTAKITMVTAVKKYVSTANPLMTDQHPNYQGMRKYGYVHEWVMHRREYVKKGNKIIHTQGIENYWSQLKRGLTGTYRRPSKKYLQRYLDEFSWRFNHRKEPEKMFDALLGKIATF